MYNVHELNKLDKYKCINEKILADCLQKSTIENNVKSD